MIFEMAKAINMRKKFYAMILLPTPFNWHHYKVPNIPPPTTSMYSLLFLCPFCPNFDREKTNFEKIYYFIWLFMGLRGVTNVKQAERKWSEENQKNQLVRIDLNHLWESQITLLFSHDYLRMITWYYRWFFFLWPI